ncbi:MAG: rod shape-determining protein MreC [Candidatus Aminicenantes bacterium]|nr:rod shape-determining protein MreC [Candidatus Aminicenantes bacterium]
MSFLRLVKNKYFLAGILFFFHLILISTQVPLGSKQTLLEKIGFQLFSPVQKTVVSGLNFIKSSYEEITNLAFLRQENQRLKKEVFFLTQEKQILTQKLRLYRAEKELTENLAFLRLTVIPARVIGFDTANFYRTAIINRGYEDQVVKNLPVCDKQGNLVGRTAEPVSAHEAKVVLITSEESGVAVASVTDKMLGILVGDGQGKCYIKYVIASSNLGIQGDEIETSGLDRVFPPGIKVGRIISISSEKGMFKKILVQPYFNLRNLELIAILKENLSER